MRFFMRFFSDNAAPVHPAVMQAMADANHIDTAYDGDKYSLAAMLPYCGWQPAQAPIA